MVLHDDDGQSLSRDGGGGWSVGVYGSSDDDGEMWSDDGDDDALSHDDDDLWSDDDDGSL